MEVRSFNIVNVRDLKAGMVFEHPRFGFPITVLSVADTSSPAWLRAACDPGHYDVECEGYGTVRIPRGNTVRLAIEAEESK